MDEEQRRRADFYARLASIPELDGLPSSAGFKLLEDLAKLGFHWLSDLPSIRRRLEVANPLLPIGEKTPAKLTSFKDNFLRVALSEIHQFASRLINGLLDKGEVDLTMFQLLDKKVLVLERETHEVTEVAKKTDPQNEMLFDLLNLIRQRKFPFSRCPVCQRVFVPVKNQKYCSPTCTYRGTEGARKEERKGYMRVYMAKKRGRQKKKASASE